MRIRWKGFELPTKVECEQETSTAEYGKFIAEPFERGYATTIGNGLRRILLSSLEGAAFTTARIEGIQHQYSTMPGIVEDATDIILNLKKVLLKIDVEGEQRLIIDAHGEREVAAGDIQCGTGVSIVNPGLHIATISDPAASLKVELTARKGRGYTPASENERNEIGVIPMDSIFSPVTRVRYLAEDTRVGQITNYDRLIIEVWTDGSVHPEMALIEAAKILRKHLDPFIYYVEVPERPMIEESITEELPASPNGGTRRSVDDLLDSSVCELGLCIRAENCLESQNITTIRELVRRTDNELLSLRNFGKTSLDDIKEKLAERGLSLGMQLDKLER